MAKEICGVSFAPQNELVGLAKLAIWRHIHSFFLRYISFMIFQFHVWDKKLRTWENFSVLHTMSVCGCVFVYYIHMYIHTCPYVQKLAEGGWGEIYSPLLSPPPPSIDIPPVHEGAFWLRRALHECKTRRGNFAGWSSTLTRLVGGTTCRSSTLSLSV